MAVNLDRANHFYTSNQWSGTSRVVAVTVPSGSEGILVIVKQLANNTATFTVNWDGTTLAYGDAAINTGTGAVNIGVFYFPNPTPQSGDVTVTFSASVRARVDVLTNVTGHSGIAQTHAQAIATATSFAYSNGKTVAAGDLGLVVGAIQKDNNQGTYTWDSTGTVDPNNAIAGTSGNTTADGLYSNANYADVSAGELTATLDVESTNTTNTFRAAFVSLVLEAGAEPDPITLPLPGMLETRLDPGDSLGTSLTSSINLGLPGMLETVIELPDLTPNLVSTSGAESGNTGGLFMGIGIGIGYSGTAGSSE